MCPFCISGIWSLPVHCGTASDEPSRSLWWSASWSGFLLLSISSRTIMWNIQRLSLLFSSSFLSHCSSSSWVGPSELCLPVVSPLMKNEELLQFWSWCCSFTRCCSYLVSFGTPLTTKPSPHCLSHFLDWVPLQTYFSMFSWGKGP